MSYFISNRRADDNVLVDVEGLQTSLDVLQTRIDVNLQNQLPGISQFVTDLNTAFDTTTSAQASNLTHLTNELARVTDIRNTMRQGVITINSKKHTNDNNLISFTDFSTTNFQFLNPSDHIHIVRGNYSGTELVCLCEFEIEGHVNNDCGIEFKIQDADQGLEFGTSPPPGLVSNIVKFRQGGTFFNHITMNFKTSGYNVVSDYNLFLTLGVRFTRTQATNGYLRVLNLTFTAFETAV